MKQDLIEALKRLARGHVDAAEAVADLLLPMKFSTFPSGNVAGKEMPPGPIEIYEVPTRYADTVRIDSDGPGRITKKKAK